MSKQKDGIYFLGIVGDTSYENYPAWRYHDLYEPILVADEDEDRQAAEKGYGPPKEPITGMPSLQNYISDLEDFSAHQLWLYAKEEFGVEFPRSSDRIQLLKAIWKLYQIAPKHKGRMVLLAQSVRMNYDETLLEIQRRIENADPSMVEVEEKEIWL